MIFSYPQRMDVEESEETAIGFFWVQSALCIYMLTSTQGIQGRWRIGISGHGNSCLWQSLLFGSFLNLRALVSFLLYYTRMDIGFLMILLLDYVNGFICCILLPKSCDHGRLTANQHTVVIP